MSMKVYSKILQQFLERNCGKSFRKFQKHMYILTGNLYKFMEKFGRYFLRIPNKF